MEVPFLYILLIFWKFMSSSKWDHFSSKIFRVLLFELSASFNFSSTFEIKGLLLSGGSNLFRRLILNTAL